MEIVLLLLTLLCFTLVLRAPHRRLAPSPLPAATLEDDDGLIALPSPDRPVGYTEKASQAEMLFAGHYLNLAGLALLSVGLLSYLKVSGLTARATSGGALQCVLGLAVGLFLSWAGDRLYGQGQRAYALPLLTCGIGILGITTATAHFIFHLLPMWALVLVSFAIVSWSGLAAIRYDSPMIGGCMLASEFLGPWLMSFPLQRPAVALAYLLAINLATTAIAYRKKWSGFLIASLGGSYLLYFSKLGLAQPAQTMTFLATTYALFLVSDNIFHFVRRTGSDFNLTLSMINPLLFACVSYTVLWQLNNGLALLIYSAIAAIHGALAYKAAGMRGQGEAYVPIARSNLALSILFSTAAISFLTYCSDETGYFALVTALLLGQGFVLLQLSRRLSPHYASLARRGSYGTMALASAQLAYVVPTMEQPLALQLLSAAALVGYFLLHEKMQSSLEARLVSNLVLVSALTTVGQALPFALVSLPGLLLTALMVPLSVIASYRFPETLAFWRALAPLFGTLIATSALLFPWPLHPVSLALIPLAGLLGSLSVLCREQGPVGALLATVLLLRGCALLLFWGPSAVLAAMALVLLALYQLARHHLPALEQMVMVLGALLGTAALFSPSEAMLGGLMVLCAGAVISLQSYGDGKLSLCAGAAGVAGLQAMRIVLLLQSGPGSTLLWCLLAILILARYPSLERVCLGVMFVAFLKSILFDANFTMGKRGLELAVSSDPRRLVLVAAVIACYAVAARLTRENPETRNYYSLFGLLVFAFQTTFVLFGWFAVLDTFQVLLSGFWAGASLLFIAFGIHAENKLFRLFGLAVLVSCVLKIMTVDIWVLDAYSKTTTTAILGSLLMAVSFLYQSNRGRLEATPCPA